MPRVDKYVGINIIRRMSRREELPLELTHRVRDTCFCLHVQRAARAVARRYDEALRPLALTNGQFTLLMSLNRGEPPTIGEVAAILAMDRTTLTANLKPLQRRRLVKVTADSEDKRSRRLVLTALGREALAAAVPAWRRVQAALERVLAASSPERLRGDLRALS